MKERHPDEFMGLFAASPELNNSCGSQKPLPPSRLTDIRCPATTSEKAELVIAHLRRKNTQHEPVQKL